MRNTVDKQSKELSDKSRKLFWCGVGEFSPNKSINERLVVFYEVLQKRYTCQLYKPQQQAICNRALSNELNFKPNNT